MHEILQVLWAAVLGWFGFTTLWAGAITLNGPEGLGPERRVTGVAAKVVGLLLVGSAIVQFHSVEVALLLFALAVVVAGACARHSSTH